MEPMIARARFERAYPGELSGGMRQRLALARALARALALAALEARMCHWTRVGR